MPHDQPEGYARRGRIYRQLCIGDVFDNPPLTFVRLQRPKKKRRCRGCNGFLRAGKTDDYCDTCKREITTACFEKISDKFAWSGFGRDTDHPNARMGRYAGIL